MSRKCNNLRTRMLFFGIGLALGVLFGTFIRKQGIKERDEEIKRLENLIDDLEYYLSKDKKSEQ